MHTVKNIDTGNSQVYRVIDIAAKWYLEFDGMRVKEIHWFQIRGTFVHTKLIKLTKRKLGDLRGYCTGLVTYNQSRDHFTTECLGG